MSNKIRPLAICIFLHQGRILVSEGYDGVKGELFYRPLGGQIEFGERSDQTICRELREEIGAEVKDLQYLGFLENIFVFQGQAGHEVVIVYDGKLVDETLYSRKILYGHEIDVQEDFKALWKPLDEFGTGSPPLYPNGLLELIKRQI